MKEVKIYEHVMGKFSLNYTRGSSFLTMVVYTPLSNSVMTVQLDAFETLELISELKNFYAIMEENPR